MKKLTQKQMQMINTYRNARYESLSECYKNCSWAKQRAENMIIKEMIDKDGYDYRICGYNSCTFSCAYRYDKDGYTHLVYHTAYNRYDFVIGVKGV